MKTLLFKGFAHADSYQGEHVPNRIRAAGVLVDPTKPEGAKHTGLVEVSAAAATYLLGTFAKLGPDDGPAFVEAKPEKGPAFVEAKPEKK